jgi:hypothetical protein
VLLLELIKFGADLESFRYMPGANNTVYLMDNLMNIVKWSLKQIVFLRTENSVDFWECLTWVFFEIDRKKKSYM